MIPFWLPWFKVGGSLIKAFSHQISTATLARPLGVWGQGSVHCLCWIKTYSHQVSTGTLARPLGMWSQGSVHCCAIALLLYILCLMYCTSCPCASVGCAGHHSNKTQPYRMSYSCLSYSVFVLVDSFIHLIFLISECSTKPVFETGDCWLVLAASYLRSCHFNFW